MSRGIHHSRTHFCLRLMATFALVGAFAATTSEAGIFKTCNRLGKNLENLENQADMLGYFDMNQPLVLAGSTTGLTEDQARDASNAKINDFQSWLAGAQSMLDSFSGIAGSCDYYKQADEMIQDGKNLIAILKNFSGPYTPEDPALAGSPAAVQNAYPIKLPCRKKGSSESGLRECEAVIKDVTKWTEDYLKGMSTAMYRGCDLSDSSILADPASCPVKNPVNTCNYFSGITGLFNTTPERDTNHFEKACGKWISVGQHVSGGKCMISATSMGTTEQSYFLGNSIRAMDCHWNQVKNEIAQGILKLTAAKGLSPAEKYETQIKLIKDGTASLAAHKNIAQIEDCTSDDLKSASAAKQSACMEYTHRLVLEQHFAHLAAIETIDRARRSFERFNVGNTSRGFFGAFKSYLRRESQSSICKGKKAQCNSSSNDYLNKCYKPIWERFFTTRSESVWNTGVCQ